MYKRQIPEPQRHREVLRAQREPGAVRQAYGVVGAVELQRAPGHPVRLLRLAQHRRRAGVRGEVGGDRIGAAARRQPVLGEAGEADLVAGVHRAALVHQADRAGADAHQVGVAGPVRGDDRAAIDAVPGPAAVVGGADHHRAAPVGIAGAGEQETVAQPQQRPLHLRCVQIRQVAEGRGEAGAAVPADGLGAVAQVGAVLLPAADQDRTVAALGERELGGLLVYKRQDQGRVVGGDPAAVPGLGVHPEDQASGVPAAGELDAVHGTGGVPGVPVGGQGLGAQIARRGPRPAVVVAVLQMRRAVAGDRAAGAVRTARVVRLRQPDPAGDAVHDRGGVAVGVAPALVDHLQRAPGAPAVGGALEHDVDVGPVPAVEDAALGERQQGAVGRVDDRRDAEARVPRVLGGLEQHLLFERRGTARRFGVCRMRGEERQDQAGRGEGCGGECGSETGAKT